LTWSSVQPSTPYPANPRRQPIVRRTERFLTFGVIKKRYLELLNHLVCTRTSQLYNAWPEQQQGVELKTSSLKNKKRRSQFYIRKNLSFKVFFKSKIIFWNLSDDQTRLLSGFIKR